VSEEGKRPLTEVVDDVLKGRIEIEDGKKAPPLPAEYKKRVPGHIRAIQRLNDQIGCDGITEYKFKYDLSPPNKKFVTGFIDRIIVRNEKAWIIDYKTTKKGPFRENRRTIKNDPQLRIYCRVVQKEMGIAPSNIKAALYYLEDEELLSSSYDEDSLEMIEKELLEIYDQVLHHRPDDARGSVGQHCQRCEYKDMCPFFKNGTKSKIKSWDGNLRNL